MIVKKKITYNSLNSILIDYKNLIHKPLFLKIDIEGSEYRILDDLIRYQDKITGLVIEFHNIDLHIEKILNFLKNFKLNLVHIHGQNPGGEDYLDGSGDPRLFAARAAGDRDQPDDRSARDLSCSRNLASAGSSGGLDVPRFSAFVGACLPVRSHEG